MDRSIVIIGACGVGKSMMRMVLMELHRKNEIVTVNGKHMAHGFTELTGVWLDEFKQICRAIESRHAEVRGEFAKIADMEGESVNVGTIGHVDYGRTSLSKAIAQAVRGDDVSRRNKSDRKRNRANRWR